MSDLYISCSEKSKKATFYNQKQLVALDGKLITMAVFESMKISLDDIKSVTVLKISKL
jgi:hypothetical protein